MVHPIRGNAIGLNRPAVIDYGTHRDGEKEECPGEE